MSRFKVIACNLFSLLGEVYHFDNQEGMETFLADQDCLSYGNVFALQNGEYNWVQPF